MSDDDTPWLSRLSATGFERGLTNYGATGFSLFLQQAFIQGAGYTRGALARPVIGIADTRSAYNPCHGNAPALMEAVQRGVMLAGGCDKFVPAQLMGEASAGWPVIPLITGSMLTVAARMGSFT